MKVRQLLESDDAALNITVSNKEQVKAARLKLVKIGMSLDGFVEVRIAKKNGDKVDAEEYKSAKKLLNSIKQKEYPAKDWSSEVYVMLPANVVLLNDCIDKFVQWVEALPSTNKSGGWAFELGMLSQEGAY